MQQTIITIDGPAGSGKSTVARNLARRLGFIHLNSGALYRVIGLQAFKRNVNLGDSQALLDLAQQLQFDFRRLPSGETELCVDGERVGAEVSSSQAAELASKVAVVPELRELLTSVQRNEGSKNSLVLEGRDAGTVVFPNASAKFFLEASLEVRFQRRAKELGLSSTREQDEKSLVQLRQEMEQRDSRDQNRKVAPLLAASDSIVIDTSGLSVEEVIEKIVHHLQSKKLLS